MAKPVPTALTGVGQTRRYEPPASGLRAMAALIVLRNKAIKPLLAAAQPLRPTRGAHNPKPIDAHYDALKLAMRRVFHEHRGLSIDKTFVGLRPEAPKPSPVPWQQSLFTSWE